MSSIVLTTLNARYIHASLGLRYLLANMGELRARTVLREFIITDRPTDIAERLLADAPRIIGIGVYIWNAEETLRLVAQLKTVAPEVIIVLGGPEVSYEAPEQPLVALADYVIQGPGDLAFAALCRQLLNGQVPSAKVLTGETPSLADLELPYANYSDHDIEHRLLYVEASRGCPFKCEFCLSALDKTAWPFELERFLEAIAALYARGGRHFKFVDRTFNLNINVSARILEFFLERLTPGLFLHFEVIPDHLPERLGELLARFPPGSLQLEVGVQTFNPDTQRLISRRQDNAKTAANLTWLRQHTHAHIHADLIVGLPGETEESFAAGFDRLVAIGPQEIQVGILKRLRGTPIARHTEAFGMRYNPFPPYNLLASDQLDFIAMQRLTRFARYWDLIGNSGRFSNTLGLLLANSPYRNFMVFCDWLYRTTGQTHQFAAERLYDLVLQGCVDALGLDESACRERLTRDYAESNLRGLPKFLVEQPAKSIPHERANDSAQAPSRQRRHLAGR